MTGVTKADLNRIYDKLEPMAQDIVSIKTRLDLQVELKQPCTFLDTHIDDHKETKKPVIAMVYDLAKMGVVAVVTYMFTRK